MLLHYKIICITLALSSALLPIDAVEELILTPLIRQGELAKAKEKAMDNINLSGVKSLLGRPTTSYSGYFTVNETFNSNLFFWLFPAIEKPEAAPAILFIDNLPGESILRDIFMEHGPFSLDENLVLKERNYTWARKHTLIYIESSVGAGFSFTDTEDGYVQSTREESEEVYKALKQIYTLFPEYQSRDLYIAGSCYAGREIPKIALKLREHDTTSKDLKFNVKGVLLNSPWLAMGLQVKFSDVLLQLGLIDDTQSELFTKEENVMNQLLGEKKYADATIQSFKITLAPGALTFTQTGFTDQKNLLHANPPPEVARYAEFINSKEVHNYPHVGLHKFEIFNPHAFSKFFDDAGHTEFAALEEILDRDVNVLFYAPQFDFLVPRLGLGRILDSLNWKGKEKFKKTRRKIWKVDDDVAGYVKSSNNFHYVMLRNAGYWAVMDQPKWCLDMVERFTSGTMF